MAGTLNILTSIPDKIYSAMLHSIFLPLIVLHILFEAKNQPEAMKQPGALKHQAGSINLAVCC